MPAKDRCAATYGRCEGAAARCVRVAGHDGNHAAVTAAGNIRGRVSWLAAPSPLDCATVGTNHSRDRVDVWHGAPDPLRVCGYHASRDDSMRQIYAAKSDRTPVR
jgi:hypothetical protein